MLNLHIGPVVKISKPASPHQQKMWWATAPSGGGLRGEGQVVVAV